MGKRFGRRWILVGGLVFSGVVGLGPADLGVGRLGGRPAVAGVGDEEPRPMPRLQPSPDPQQDPSLLGPQPKKAVPVDDQERPFYKSTVFWVVTGALVGGAIGLGIYAANHGSPSNLSACPASANLGCFGEGR